MLLYSVPWPAQGLYFKKEINSVADMKGINKNIEAMKKHAALINPTKLAAKK